MKTLQILGYVFEIMETQGKEIELLCRLKGQTIEASSTRSLTTRELFKFYQYTKDRGLYESCGSQIDDILISLIVDHRYQHCKPKEKE